MLKVLLNHELLLMIRSRGWLISGLFSSSAMFTTLHLAVKSSAVNLVWACLVFSLIAHHYRIFHDDFKDGTIEQLTLALPNLELYVLAKILANWIAFFLPLVLLGMFLSSIDQVNAGLLLRFFLINLFGGLPIIALATFCSSLPTSKLSIANLLALPLILPLLLISFSGIFGENFARACQILLGLNFLLIPISILATTKIIKISLE